MTNEKYYMILKKQQFPLCWYIHSTTQYSRKITGLIRETLYLGVHWKTIQFKLMGHIYKHMTSYRKKRVYFQTHSWQLTVKRCSFDLTFFYIFFLIKIGEILIPIENRLQAWTWTCTIPDNQECLNFEGR